MMKLPKRGDIRRCQDSISIAAENLRDDWERAKGSLHKDAGDLTDDDFLSVETQKIAIVECIRQKTGRTRHEIARALRLE